MGRAEAAEQPLDWRVTVAIIWVAVLIAIMGMSLVIPFLPLYLRELGVPEHQTRLWAGWVGGANFLCSGLVAPFWGNVADRYGRKAMTIRALAGLAVSVGLMSYAQNVYQLFGLRMLQGMFGGFVAAAIALVGTSVPRDSVGGTLGFLQSAVVGGHLVGPLLGGELSSALGYRATFRITGLALVAAALLIVLLVREPPREPNASPPVGVGRTVREFLQIPAFRFCLIAVLASQCGLMLVNPQISLFVEQLRGRDGGLNRAVGLVIAAPALSSFLAAPLWGRFGDRRGHAAALAMALLGAALVSPLAALCTSVTWLFCVRFGLGAFTSALNPLTHSTVAHAVPAERTAGAFSLLSSAQMLGACIGPFASGPIATLVGIRPLFPVAGACLFGAAILAWRSSGAKG